MSDSYAKQLRQNVPIYNGRPNESILRTLEEFKAYSIYEGWDPATKCQKIIGFLGGRARRKFMDQIPADVKADWNRLKPALVEAFTPEGANRIYISAFFSRCQAPGEPAISFLDDLHNLARHAFPGFDQAHRDELVRGQFLVRLQDPLATYLNTHRPTATLEELEIAANNFETGPKIARGLDSTIQNRELDQQRVFVGLTVRDQGQMPTLSHGSISYQNGPFRRDSASPRGRSRGGPHMGSTRGGQHHMRSARGGQRGSQSQLRWTVDGTPICLQCEQPGHVRKNCPRGNITPHRGIQGRTAGYGQTRRGQQGQSRGTHGHGINRRPVRVLQIDESDETSEEGFEHDAYESNNPETSISDEGPYETIALLQEQNRRLQARGNTVHIVSWKNEETPGSNEAAHPNGPGYVSDPNGPGSNEAAHPNGPGYVSDPNGPGSNEATHPNGPGYVSDPNGPGSNEAAHPNGPGYVSDPNGPGSNKTAHPDGPGYASDPNGPGPNKTVHPNEPGCIPDPNGPGSNKAAHPNGPGYEFEPNGPGSDEAAPPNGLGHEPDPNGHGSNQTTYQNEDEAWHRAAPVTFSLNWTPVIMTVMLLLLSLAQGTTTGTIKKDLHFCDQTTGTQLWSNTYQPFHRATRLGRLTVHGGAMFAWLTLRFYDHQEAFLLFNATLCKCWEQEIQTKGGLRNNRYWTRYNTSMVSVQEMECQQMVQSKQSSFGKLLWNGVEWTTDTLEWVSPQIDTSLWQALIWRKQTRTICTMRNMTLTKLATSDYVTSPMIPTQYCLFNKEICHLPDQSLVMWELPAIGPSQYSKECLNPVEPLREGVARIDKVNLRMIENEKSVDIDQELYWVPLDTNVPAVTWTSSSRYKSGVLALPLCSNLTTTSIPHHFAVGVGTLHYIQEQTTRQESSSDTFVPMYISHKHLAILNATLQRRAFVNNAYGAFEEHYQLPNVSVASKGDLVATQQCYTVSNCSFRELSPQTWPNPHPPGTERVPILAYVRPQWIYGFLDKATNKVYPNSRVQEDAVVQALAEPGDTAIYMLPRIGIDKFDVAHPRTQTPTHVFATFHPFLGPGIQPLLHRHAYQEFVASSRAFPFHDPSYPLGLYQLWLSAAIIYITLFCLVLHCTPCFKCFRAINPFSVFLKLLTGIQRRYERNRKLTVHTVDIRSSSHGETIPLQPIRRRRSQQQQQQQGHSPDLQDIVRKHYQNRQVRVMRPLIRAAEVPREREIPTSACHVKIQDTKLTALLDTGAQMSLLTRSHANRLGFNPQPDEINAAEALSGHEVRLDGKIMTDLKIGRKTLKDQSLYVVEELGQFDMILGCDALARLGTIMFDFRRGKLHVSEPTAQVNQARILPVKLVETVKLPARSEMILMTELPMVKDNVDYQLEPRPEFLFKKGVYMAGALVRPRRNRIPMRLMNPEPSEICLYKGTTVGQLHMLGNSKTVAVIQTVSNSIGTDSENPSVVATDPLTELDLGESILENGQKQKLITLLRQYMDVFSRSSDEVGCIPGVEHHINTKDHPPIRQRPYRTEFSQRTEVQKQIKQLTEAGFIRPSSSPWASPIVLVDKKDGTKRFCVDYRRLNSITEKDVFPLPLISEVLDSVGGSKFFTSFDVTSGYHHITISEPDIPKTAFICCEGAYEWLRMPFGLTTAPGTFQRAMQCVVLAGLTPQVALCYLDDVLVYHKTFEEHLRGLEEVLKRFRIHGLKMKLKKCKFCPAELEYLGYIITPHGLKPDKKKVEAMEQFPKPCSVSELRRFLGLIGYYRRFIRGFAQLARPLFDLLKKDKPYDWQPRQQAAFEDLKKGMISAPILAYPRFDKPFILETDASTLGLGCVLSQEDNDSFARPIAYASRTLSPAEKNYSITELECLAATWSLKMFRPYVYGQKCRVITDHSALKWLFKQSSPNGRLNRWSLLLQEYDLDIEYRPGRKHEKADALSRAPIVGIVQPVNRNLLDAQQRDPFSMQVMQFLKTGTLTGDALKADIMKLAKRLELSPEGYLVLKNPKLNRNTKTVFVPHPLRRPILEEYHKTSLGGHLGIQKTLDRIRLKYFWPLMHQDIENLVSTCERCQQRKQHKETLETHHIQSTQPWELLEVDVMELPQTFSGNKYVVVFTDHFTKFTEAFAVENQTAETIANLLINEIICRFGSPKKLLSDRGTNFLSRLVLALCKLMKVKKVTSTAYAPQTQGLVERTNRTLQDMLAKLIEDKHQRDWDDYLPAILFALRNTPQSTTQETPHYLLFGTDGRMPIDSVLNYPDSIYVDVDELPYLDALQYRLTKAWTIAAATTQAAHNVSGSASDPQNMHEYKKGDKVLLKRTDYPGRAAKLGNPWKGPYEITNVYDNLNVELQDPEFRYTPFLVHRRRVKPYKTSTGSTGTPFQIETTGQEVDSGVPRPVTPISELEHVVQEQDRAPPHPSDPNLEMSDSENSDGEIEFEDAVEQQTACSTPNFTGINNETLK